MCKKKAKKNQQHIVRCPYCGAVAVIRPAAEIYQDERRKDELYVCRNYPSCKAYVGIYPGTRTPMGPLANGDLRNLRIRAHRKFDRLWQSGIMSRQDAYRWMADYFCLPQKEAHIIMHPPSVYMALTGEYDDNKTEDDVFQKLLEIAVGRLAVKEEKHGQRIRYVDTPLIEAIRTSPCSSRNVCCWLQNIYIQKWPDIIKPPGSVWSVIFARLSELSGMITGSCLRK